MIIAESGDVPVENVNSVTSAVSLQLQHAAEQLQYSAEQITCRQAEVAEPGSTQPSGVAGQSQMQDSDEPEQVLQIEFNNRTYPGQVVTWSLLPPPTPLTWPNTKRRPKSGP